jgi:hypothetical protein
LEEERKKRKKKGRRVGLFPLAQSRPVRRKGEEGLGSLAQPSHEREREKGERNEVRERKRRAFPATGMGSSCVSGEPTTQIPLASMPRAVFFR